MNWIILGARGQLGRTLTGKLVARDLEHIALDRDALDITNPSSIADIAKLNGKLIVNCAGWTDVEGAEVHEEEARLVNGEGPANLARLARTLEIPLIHVSTDYVFSGISTRPWRSDDPTEPISAYGRSKLLGEQGVLANYSTGSIVLRTAWLYSEYSKNFAKTILRKALTSSDEIKVVVDQIGQPTTTYDLADRIIDVGTQKIPAGTYHAVNSGSASWWDLAFELVNKAGLNTERVVKIESSEFSTRAQRPKYSVLESSDWGKMNLEPMQDWRSALDLAFPKIMQAVKAELSSG